MYTCLYMYIYIYITKAEPGGLDVRVRHVAHLRPVGPHAGPPGDGHSFRSSSRQTCRIPKHDTKLISQRISFEEEIPSGESQAGDVSQASQAPGKLRSSRRQLSLSLSLCFSARVSSSELHK